MTPAEIFYLIVISTGVVGGILIWKGLELSDVVKDRLEKRGEL